MRRATHSRRRPQPPPGPNAVAKLDPELLHRITRRGVAEIIPEAEFISRLEEGKPLKLKMGFDPSRPDLHLGHVVGLRKLRQLQDLGHELILIVGDWTAQIGDPSGESDTRTMLSADEVKRNAESYMQQFYKVVDPERTRAVYQSEWFGSFTLDDVIKLTSQFTVNQFLHRDDFAKRYAAERPIAVTEMLYPLLQAYDSVAIEADVEFGGTDQKFNLLVGRELQQRMGQRPQCVFLMPILPGTDGVRRMGKSLGNYIALEDPPAEMFGKILSLPDDVLPLYFELLTDAPDDELASIRSAVEAGGSGALALKKRLAGEMVSWFHSPDAAGAAKAEFERVVQGGEQPADVRSIEVHASDAGVLAVGAGEATLDLPRFLAANGMAPSVAQAARLLSQGAVEVGGQTVAGREVTVAYGAVVRVGRRRFFRVVKG
ncbi:MAG: tyrosine--tRNA ligase [Chloroflexi bacterium]|nr:tyrosine--tRNA ligase [Chloroflexota bacterium]